MTDHSPSSSTESSPAADGPDSLVPPPATSTAVAETPVASAVLRIVPLGAVRLVYLWPGVVVVLVAYAAVAIALFDRSYPNLWGGLAAAVTAAAWYASPMRRIESRRRERLRAARAA